MNTEPLSMGPRWWRVLLNGAIACVTLFGGLAAVLGGSLGLIGSDAPESIRNKVLSFTVIAALGVLALTTSFLFCRATLAHATKRGAEPVSDPDRIPLGLLATSAYGAITGIVLLTSAQAVPLWSALLILAIPPLALLRYRLPAMRRARAARATSRAAKAQAGKPVVTTRRQRVVRGRSRAQRRI